MRTARPAVSVIGGGLGGLIAALACVELGHPVELFEANARLGGRARSSRPPYIANLGPHALYADGPMWNWLARRDLLPPTVRPSLRGFRICVEGRPRRFHPPLARAALRLPRQAPVDRDYRSWACEHVGERAAAAAIGLLSVPTFDHDPGRLSAAFCQERFRRLTLRASAVRYVRGGWGELVKRLSERARQAGVKISTGHRLEQLPDPPVIVAMSLAAAARFLGNEELVGTGTRAVLLDLGLRGARERPAAMVDIDAHVYISRPSHVDRRLAPEHHDLIQASAGVRPGESMEAATARIEASLDTGFPGWREAERWRRRVLVDDSTGALDPVGCGWSDRPLVTWGEGIYLVGDAVAAPGILSEVTHASALQAARAIASGKEVGASWTRSYPR